MLIRIWTTEIHAEKESIYLSYGQDKSRWMFLQQPGCLGVLFLILPEGRHAACSFWRSQADIDLLQNSESYQKTSAGLEATGALKGSPEVVIYAVEGVR